MKWVVILGTFMVIDTEGSDAIVTNDEAYGPFPNEEECKQYVESRGFEQWDNYDYHTICILNRP